MERLRYMLAMGILTLAFWGVMYPQFSLVQETYTSTESKQDAREDFYTILSAGNGEIEVKSRLWEWWKSTRK